MLYYIFITHLGDINNIYTQKRITAYERSNYFIITPIRPQGLKSKVKEVKIMKKAIKRISAIAIALTLLSTGAAATKSIAPQAAKPMTAQAICQYHHGTYVQGYYINNRYWDSKTKCWRCKCCNQPV